MPCNTARGGELDLAMPRRAIALAMDVDSLAAGSPAQGAAPLEGGSRPLPLNEPEDRCPDAELLRRIRRGDDEAFAQLVERHGGRLYAVAVSMLGNSADAEDAVQETLTGAFSGLRGFQGRSSVKTWLTRILVRRVARLRRRRRPLRIADSIEQVPGPPGSADIALDVRASWPSCPRSTGPSSSCVRCRG